MDKVILMYTNEYGIIWIIKPAPKTSNGVHGYTTTLTTSRYTIRDFKDQRVSIKNQKIRAQALEKDCSTILCCFFASSFYLIPLFLPAWVWLN